MSKGNKVYVIKNSASGLNGIVLTSEELLARTNGQGNVFDTYDSLDEAKKSLSSVHETDIESNENVSELADNASMPENIILSDAEFTSIEDIDGPYAFTDGSFNSSTNTYGYGGFLNVDGREYAIYGSGSEDDIVSSHNICGEVYGVRAAIQKAVDLGLPKLTVLYDYVGIGPWAKGSWKANKKISKDFQDFIASMSHKIQITFIKVKGHSNIPGNEKADRIARYASGATLNAKDTKMVEDSIRDSAK